MSYYSFPVLSVSELVSWLGNLERPSPPLMASDLTEPTFANMRILYYQFVEMIMGVRADELQQPHFDHIEALGEYPQLHETSIAEATIMKHLTDLMHVVGVNDFSWRDLVYPEKKRTIRNLSAIINFAKFRQDRLETFHEYLEKTERLNETRQELHDENQQLRGQKEVVERERAEEAPEIARIRDETDALAAQLAALNKNASSLRRDIREEKQRMSKLKDQNDSDKFKIMGVKKDIDRLETQIVRSPERLKKTLGMMSNNVENEKREIEQMMTSVREAEAKLQQLHKGDNRILKRISAMDEIAELLQKSKKLSKDVKEQTNAIAANEEMIGELVRDERYLKEQINKASEKLFKLQKQFEKKRTAADMALTEVQAEKMALQQKIEQQRHVLERNLAETESAKRRLDTMKQQHQTHMNTLRSKYEQLHSQLRSYHASLTEAMTATSASFERTEC